MKTIYLLHGESCLVDDNDFITLVGELWYKDERGYAMAKINGKNMRMHRVIMQALESQEIDHKDRNKLNNQRNNLRFATRSENCFNTKVRVDSTSGFKGVNFHKASGKWRVNLGTQYIGLFETLEKAIEARKSVEKGH